MKLPIGASTAVDLETSRWLRSKTVLKKNRTPPWGSAQEEQTSEMFGTIKFDDGKCGPGRSSTRCFCFCWICVCMILSADVKKLCAGKVRGN